VQASHLRKDLFHEDVIVDENIVEELGRLGKQRELPRQLVGKLWDVPRVQLSTAA
jgi:hypothetical protein